MINKVKFKNFKKHRNLEIEFNDDKNIITGENGVGKSSLIEGITYVLNGSFSQIENIGFKNLFNTDVIEEFNSRGKKDFDELPVLIIELYLKDVEEPKAFELLGRHNTENAEKYGLYMKLEPDDDYTQEIKDILDDNTVFPFEYYKLVFSTFGGQRYSSYKKKHKFRYEVIDSSKINSNQRIEKYISNLFNNSADKDKRQTMRYNFRNIVNDFSETMYDKYELISSNDYELKIGTSNNQMLDHNISAYKNNVSIHNQGQGEQILLGVQTSVIKNNEDIKIILIEEPENHLSYLNMQKLINIIDETYGQQMIISTHSNMIASRLELSNLIMLSENNYKKFDDSPDKTVRYFKKSPDSNLLNFILAKKVILVEGTAEYILMHNFYKNITGNDPFEDDVTIISVGGLNFKYYLELAEQLNSKVAVITDNDEKYKENILLKYEGFEEFENIKIYSEEDDFLSTFEISMYENNKELFEEHFQNNYMSNGLQEYMLNNKTEFAMRLLETIEDEEDSISIVIPDYIEDAVLWLQ